MKNILGNTNNLELFNKKGKKLYEFITYSNGFSYERTYDEKGNVLTYKDSNGFSCEITYDEKGNRLTYKNSNGTYIIRGKIVTKEEYESFINGTPEYTMEELVSKLGYNFKIKK